MKADAKVLSALNDVLVAEMTAANQYLLSSRLTAHRGYARLAARFYKESIAEMRHADALVKRIIHLGGLPNVQKLDRIRLAETVPEQLRLDLQLERASVTRLNETITLARQRGDHGTADVLEELLEAAEEHVDWLEAQQALLKELGEASYLAQQIHEHEG
jgi:bacterioferritin